MVVGKGLEALIPKKKPVRPRDKVQQDEASGKGVFFVETGKVHVDERQPRKDFPKAGLVELAASIRQHGILQPLVVEKVEEETAKGVGVLYHLLAGERRLRAARMVGLKQVPVVIRPSSDNRTRLLVSLIENVQREDLNAMERAEAFARLRDDFGLSQEEIGTRIGKSREAVANTLRLLQLDESTRLAIRKGQLSEGHARALLAVPEKRRDTFLKRMKEAPMSVREAEALARQFSGTLKAPVRAADPRRARDEERLRQALGVPARITTRGERGSIAFIFHSKKEFVALLKKLIEIKNHEKPR